MTHGRNCGQPNEQWAESCGSVRIVIRGIG
jgi:hypothetical protein